jgi:ABC-type multidrug transport system permease subunit
MNNNLKEYQNTAEKVMLLVFTQVFILSLIGWVFPFKVIAAILGFLIIALLIVTIINTILSLIIILKYVNEMIDKLFKQYEKNIS